MSVFYMVNSNEGLYPIREFEFDDNNKDYLLLYGCVCDDEHFGLYSTFKVLDGITIRAIEKYYNSRHEYQREYVENFPKGNAISIRRSVNQYTEAYTTLFKFESDEKCREYLTGINQFNTFNDAWIWAKNFAKQNANNYYDVFPEEMTHIDLTAYIDGVKFPSVTISAVVQKGDEQIKFNANDFTYRWGWTYDIENGHPYKNSNYPLSLTKTQYLKSETPNGQQIMDTVGIAFAMATQPWSLISETLNLFKGIFGNSFMSLEIIPQCIDDIEILIGQRVKLGIPKTTKGLSAEDVPFEISGDGVTTNLTVVLGAYKEEEDTFLNNDKTTFDKDSDTTESIISNPYANTMLSTHKITPVQLRSFNDFLWSSSFIDHIGLLNTNPIENIIGLTLTRNNGISGTTNEIKVGNVSTGVNAEQITTTLQEFTVGTFNIPYYYNSFLDFAPYTQVLLFLPFADLIDLDCSLIMGKTCTVKAYIDVISATISYKLFIDGVHFDTICGRCGVDLPLTASNAPQVMFNIARAEGNAIFQGLTQNYVGMANTLIDTATQPMRFTRNGSTVPCNILSETTECYVVVNRPVVNYPSTYNHNYGRPCNLSRKIGGLSGYTEIENIDTSTLHAPLELKEKLVDALRQGFYV